MKSALMLVLGVTLLAAACGKSGAAGEAGSGGAGTAGRESIGGAAGAETGAGGAVAGRGGASGAGGNTRGAGGGAGRATGGTGGTSGGAGGATGGTGGTVRDAGTTGTDGGVDAAPACTTGETRCDGSGRRLRCASGGSWVDDNYVCTVALSGSSDYDTMCALKADGRLACWAAGDWANGQAAMMVTRAPADTWQQISVSDDAYELCGIGAAGTISCWNAMGTSPRPPLAGTFAALSYSSYGSCALTDAGMPVCFNGPLLPADFVGRFKQIVTANYFVYGIDENDALHVPASMAPSYPARKYKQIIANNNASCALRDDGAIFCWPAAGMLESQAGETFLAPPTGNGFLEVAAIYGNDSACAIRADHTVTCWLGLSSRQPLATPPTGTFTHIAGCDAAMCGIRTDGTTVCWAVPGVEPMVPPTGW
jgi:hypothetical protein